MSEGKGAATAGHGKGFTLVYRQTVMTRITHWAWAFCLFFLLLSGLQIFMARPDLYLGEQSGFGFDNTIFSIGAVSDGNALGGRVSILGTQFDTTGWLGAVAENGRMVAKSFPGWMTIPGYRDLATGRVVHFFFAWALSIVLLVWFVSALVTGHIRRIVPGWRDLRSVPKDLVDHLRFRFHDGPRYGALQKLSYASVLFVALPLMILTGLTMSPGVNAFAPWMPDLFGGRQTARTIHFVVMLALVLFFVVHIAMVLLAGPLNELRSMTTGWFRVPGTQNESSKSGERE